MMPDGNIYLVGASGTGKTTLACELAEVYGLQILPSAARMVAREMNVAETQFEKLLADEDKFAEYQRRVCEKQIKLEAESQERFVSCRAFDCLIFEALYGTMARWTFTSVAFAEYMSKIVAKQRANPIIFVRPHPVTNALAHHQGERKPYLNWNDVMRFDGAMKFFMECHGVGYYSSEFCDDSRQRVQGVCDHLKSLNFQAR